MGVMDHPGLGRQRIEVIPGILEDTDRIGRLKLEINPVGIIARELEHLLEVLLDLPVPEPGVVEQHDARSIVLGTARPALAGHERPASHVALDERHDVR